MFSEYNYDYLESKNPTTHPEDAPVKEILLNLTGNMARYVWSLNGVPLAETDKIKIEGDGVTRITFNNLTMNISVAFSSEKSVLSISLWVEVIGGVV